MRIQTDKANTVDSTQTESRSKSDYERLHIHPVWFSMLWSQPDSLHLNLTVWVNAVSGSCSKWVPPWGGWFCTQTQHRRHCKTLRRWSSCCWDPKKLQAAKKRWWRWEGQQPETFKDPFGPATSAAFYPTTSALKSIGAPVVLTAPSAPGGLWNNQPHRCRPPPPHQLHQFCLWSSRLHVNRTALFVQDHCRLWIHHRIILSWICLWCSLPFLFFCL